MIFILLILDFSFISHIFDYNFGKEMNKIKIIGFDTKRLSRPFISYSECTKRDILELGGIIGDNISLIYQSCNPHIGKQLTDQQLAETIGRYSLPNSPYGICISFFKLYFI